MVTINSSKSFHFIKGITNNRYALGASLGATLGAAGGRSYSGINGGDGHAARDTALGALVGAAGGAGAAHYFKPAAKVAAAAAVAAAASTPAATAVAESVVAASSKLQVRAANRLAKSKVAAADYFSQSEGIADTLDAFGGKDRPITRPGQARFPGMHVNLKTGKGARRATQMSMDYGMGERAAGVQSGFGFGTGDGNQMGIW